MRRRKAKTSFIAVLLEVIAIHFCYMYIYRDVAPLYSYMYNFKVGSVSVGGLLWSLVLLPIIAYFVYRQQENFSSFNLFLTLLNLVYFLPGATMMTYSNWSSTYCLFFVLSMLALSGIGALRDKVLKSKEGGAARTRNIPHNYVEQYQKVHRSRRLVFSGKQISFFTLFICVLTTAIIVRYNGFTIHLSLKDAYEMREEWATSSMPNIFNYFIPYTARILPVLLLIYLYKKNYLVSTAIIITQLISFSFGGLKYTLFALFASIAIFFIPLKQSKINISFLYALFVLIAAAEIFFIKTDFLGTFIVRRYSFITTQIGYYFFDFTQQNGPLFYSESFLRAFLDYPYQQAFPHVIGEFAFSRNTGANTGLLAEGFSQIGWMSLLVYPLLYLVAFGLLDQVFRNGRFHWNEIYLNRIRLLFVALYTLSFIDGTYFSVLLTQGFILSFLTILMLVNSNIFDTQRV